MTRWLNVLHTRSYCACGRRTVIGIHRDSLAAQNSERNSARSGRMGQKQTIFFGEMWANGLWIIDIMLSAVCSRINKFRISRRKIVIRSLLVLKCNLHGELLHCAKNINRLAASERIHHLMKTAEAIYKICYILKSLTYVTVNKSILTSDMSSIHIMSSNSLSKKKTTTNQPTREKRKRAKRIRNHLFGKWQTTKHSWCRWNKQCFLKQCCNRRTNRSTTSSVFCFCFFFLRFWSCNVFCYYRIHLIHIRLNFSGTL